MTEGTIAAIIAGSGLTALVAAQAALRRRREQRDERALARNAASGLHQPASLHPVIDPDVCIGSLSCLRACPEGDILGVIGGAARLVHAANCVGHGRCAAACPVHAIQLVFGTATRGVDLPEVDERFESSRPGVHVIGELGGMGLIRNAVEQAAQCAEAIGDALGRASKDGGAAADVVVIGSGPAGVACALGLRARGLSVRVLERSKLGGALTHYPRHALVMSGPLELPGAGRLRQQRVGKQELLAFFEKALRTAGLVVEEGVTVTGLDGRDGAFSVATASGSFGARKVVLATGLRGSPRKLGVPGEGLPKVTYSLADAGQYDGARVLVVGGGDAAVEAACALAERGAAQVALSYRKAELVRCRAENTARALELARNGRLELMLPSQLKRIEEQFVVLERGPEVVAFPNDFVIACLGGQLPLEFLDKMGVQVRRHFGEQERARRPGTGRASWTLSRDEARRRRWWRWMGLLGVAGLVFLGGLAWVGMEYYPLSGSLRLRSPLHPRLKSASSLGISIGIAASAVMLTNFLYALRKRWNALEGLGSLRSWLDLHVFVGVMSPLVIAFHAAFQSNNLLATGTYVSLGIVVSTGLVGRWFYALVPGTSGRAVELSDLLGQIERLKDQVEPMVADAGQATLATAFARATAAPPRAPLVVQVAQSALERAALEMHLAVALRSVPPGGRAPLRRGLVNLQRLRRQVGLFGGIQRLMRAWRNLHISLAALLVLALVAHVSVAVYLGYGPGSR